MGMDVRLKPDQYGILRKSDVELFTWDAYIKAGEVDELGKGDMTCKSVPHMTLNHMNKWSY